MSLFSISLKDAYITVKLVSELKIGDVALYDIRLCEIVRNTGNEAIGKEIGTENEYIFRGYCFQVRNANIDIVCLKCGELIRNEDMSKPLDLFEQYCIELAEKHRCSKLFRCDICKTTQKTRVYYEEKDPHCGCGAYFIMVYECPTCLKTTKINQCRIK